jgi:hypothetical protein
MLPIEGPTKGAAGQEFEAERVDFTAPEAGGALGGVQAGFPRWQATWTLGKMGQLASDEWRAFFAELRGAQRPFLGRDLARPFPLAYVHCGFTRMTKVGGAPFLGAADDWSVSIDDEGYCLLTLEGVPAGLVLSKIDYVGFKWDAAGAEPGSYGRRALVRLIRPAVADGSGNVILVVEPPVPGLVPADAIAHLDRPACVMKRSPESKLGAIDRSLAVKSGTLVALEDLRP